MNQLNSVLKNCLHGFRAMMAQPTPGPEEKIGRSIQIVSYGCITCGETHEDEEDADNCCTPKAMANGAKPGPIACPICGETSGSHRAASDCCLWKDLAAYTRWAIADRVELGSTWQEEIEALADLARTVH